MDLIAATLIVKNEANTIAKTLASLQENVDKIIVLDTGSTDGTLDILRAHGVLLFEEPFTTYADTRNRALELAGQHAPSKFTLTLSADETLVGGTELRKYLTDNAGSNAGAFCVMMRSGPRQWPFPRILRTGGGWKFFNTAGGFHEQPGGPNGEIVGPLVPGVFVIHEESNFDRKLERLRQHDLPALTAEVEDESKSLDDRAEAIYQLAETHFILGHNEPLGDDRKPVVGGRWRSHKFASMALYARYAEIAQQPSSSAHDTHKAMYAWTMYVYVAQTFGLFEPVELVKRLRPIAEQSIIPEAHWLLAKNAAEVDPKKAIQYALRSAKIARAVYERPIHGAVDVNLEWQSYLLAADCAKAIKDKRLMREYAQKALEAGAPRSQVGDMAGEVH